MGGRGYGGERRGRLYTYRYTVTTRMMPASLIVTDKATRQCPQTTTFEVKGERKQIRTGVSAYLPNALPLGQTGSL